MVQIKVYNSKYVKPNNLQLSKTAPFGNVAESLAEVVYRVEVFTHLATPYRESLTDGTQSCIVKKTATLFIRTMLDQASVAQMAGATQLAQARAVEDGSTAATFAIVTVKPLTMFIGKQIDLQYDRGDFDALSVFLVNLVPSSQEQHAFTVEVKAVPNLKFQASDSVALFTQINFRQFIPQGGNYREMKSFDVECFVNDTVEDENHVIGPWLGFKNDTLIGQPFGQLNFEIFASNSTTVGYKIKLIYNKPLIEASSTVPTDFHLFCKP